MENKIFAEKTLADCLLVPQKMSHPQILWRKLLRIATKPWNLRKFSPSKVSRYMVQHRLCDQHGRVTCNVFSVFSWQCGDYAGQVLPKWNCELQLEFTSTHVALADRIPMLQEWYHPWTNGRFCMLWYLLSFWSLIQNTSLLIKNFWINCNHTHKMNG